MTASRPIEATEPVGNRPSSGGDSSPRPRTVNATTRDLPGRTERRAPRRRPRVSSVTTGRPISSVARTSRHVLLVDESSFPRGMKPLAPCPGGAGGARRARPRRPAAQARPARDTARSRRNGPRHQRTLDGLRASSVHTGSLPDSSISARRRRRAATGWPAGADPAEESAARPAAHPSPARGVHLGRASAACPAPRPASRPAQPAPRPPPTARPARWPPRHAHRTVRILGATAKQMPWSTP